MRTRHESRAHPNKQYICEQCGEVFGVDRRQFSSHMKKTHRSAVYKCEFCSLTFVSLRLMHEHIRAHHHPHPPAIAAPAPPQPPPRKQERVHIVLEPEIEAPDVQAVVSIENGGSNVHVRSVASSHGSTGGGSAKGGGRGGQQARSSATTSSAAIVNSGGNGGTGGTASFKCTYCTRTFNRKDCWKKHERSHTGEKPYKCRFCVEPFACTTARARHELKFHQGEKYQCEECRQEFPTKQLYNSHMKGSHPDEPGSLRCGLCAKTFKEANELERHVTAIHSSHDERLMRACSSLLPSHISAAIIKEEASMLNVTKDHSGQGHQQSSQAQQQAQQQAHFIAPEILEEDNPANELFET